MGTVKCTIIRYNNEGMEEYKVITTFTSLMDIRAGEREREKGGREEGGGRERGKEWGERGMRGLFPYSPALLEVHVATVYLLSDSPKLWSSL